MILLLDTNCFIWTIADAGKLNKQTAADIASPANRVYVSDASLLECAIKQRIGKLETDINFLSIDQYLAGINIQQLPFDAWSAEHYVGLPHTDWADPFDLALIAQAMAKRMTLVTSDTNILNSKIKGLRIMKAGR